MANQVYWVGADNNVYLKGASGVQNLGSSTSANYNLANGGFESNTLGQSIQAQRIADPNPPAAASSSGTSSSSSAAAPDYTGEAQYWADQIAQDNAQLNRIGTQRSVGEGNIINSYNSAYATLQQQQAQANRDLSTQKQGTINDNITAKNSIDDSVHQNLTGLQALLASRGAGGSGAYNTVVPYVAATQGNAQRNTVQSEYAKNLSAIDTAQGDSDTKFTNAFGDLTSQKTDKENTLNSSLAQTEAGIQQQLAQAQVSKTQAAGGNYAAAHAAEAPYLARINDLLNQVDQAGAQVSFTPQTVAYTPPSLASYTYDPTAQAALTGSGVAPGQQSQVGSYFNLLTSGQKKDGSPLTAGTTSTQ